MIMTKKIKIHVFFPWLQVKMKKHFNHGIRTLFINDVSKKKQVNYEVLQLVPEAHLGVFENFANTEGVI